MVNRRLQVSQLKRVVDLRVHHITELLARRQSSTLHQLSPPGKTNAFVMAFAFLGTHSRERGGDMMVNRDLAYGRAGKRLLQGQGAVGWDAQLP